MSVEITLGKIVVLDLEQACWEHQPPGEIIEVGVCLLTVPELDISKPRRIFLKPQRDEISEFCTKFTGITADILAQKGKSKEQVAAILRGEFKVDQRVWAGWGSDGPELEVEFQQKFNQSYINLCSLFAVMVGSPNRVGLERALEMTGQEFKGIRHTGGDDAYNACRVLKWMMERIRDGKRG